MNMPSSSHGSSIHAAGASRESDAEVADLREAIRSEKPGAWI
jgi:hypothetical protein